MGRPTDLDLSDFETYLRRDTSFEPSTRRMLPSGVRWIFRHFGGEWPPSGAAVREALRGADISSATESVYARAWDVFLNFQETQGFDVSYLRRPRVSRRDDRRTMSPEALAALRRLVDACTGFSFQKVAVTKWGAVTFHRDYIRITGHRTMIAFDPSHVDDFCTIARWGFGLTDDTSEEDVLARISVSPTLPMVPRIRGEPTPATIETIRRWVAKYG